MATTEDVLQAERAAFGLENHYVAVAFRARRAWERRADVLVEFVANGGNLEEIAPDSATLKKWTQILKGRNFWK